ncbi:MAG: YdaS family helix-turn-helix protein [Desulfuromonas sp.]|nr:YdaS family helix-turn-helix protein [Desulfuromonas sp.]
MSKRHEELLAWLKTAGDKEVSETKTSAGYLRQIGYGNKKASAELASRIEMITGGKISRKQLRPDDWFVIWPELVA